MPLPKILYSDFSVLDQRVDYFVQLLSAPFIGKPSLTASPAQYGPSLLEVSVISLLSTLIIRYIQVEGEVVVAEPFRGCSPLTNANKVELYFTLTQYLSSYVVELQ